MLGRHVCHSAEAPEYTGCRASASQHQIDACHPQVRCSTNEQGLDGVCGTDGLCYTSDLDIDGQIKEWTKIYNNFVSSDSIKNLQALSQYRDINSTVALAKAAVAKIALEHQLVLLGAGAGFR